ncbi:MAG TPA: DNA mismatch repair protein MutS, partial [Gammaproteobacteria bacterium]|nr:DNA mismatch repair protein MutS [Gammaproteobacteria bacterium]
IPRLIEYCKLPEQTVFATRVKKIQTFPNIIALLDKAMEDNPPMTVRDGGVIRFGYDAQLDELRLIYQDCEEYIKKIEQQEQKKTGISTLKVDYNKVHGFYIEISKGQAKNAPVGYQRRQTLKNAERFITEELKKLEDKVLSAKEKSLALEKKLYQDILAHLVDYVKPLQNTATYLAQIDVLLNLAERAETLNLVKPHLVDAHTLHIQGGRHPVIAHATCESFVPNDLHLDDATKLLLITGPNMGGKSTYMRQTALIVLLAHIGSFVPATSAILGPIDRIFTRIGAHDDLASNQSTFMVEMTETAQILHHASHKSLVLMDEIGRGTSTYDGLSLAWAVLEYLSTKVQAYTLFSTHYFELTQLAENLPNTQNCHLDAKEHERGISFFYKVEPGPANKSYGIQVAKLSGIPLEVIQKAQEKLCTLETASTSQPKETQRFEQKSPTWLNLVAQIQPDHCSPKEALEFLYQLKKAFQEEH